ncbi:hypothetical protein RRG08_055367 [Elysia crispata]|uniref:Secreted protein n=1 Tax=Elysia crispata TaxID=231223 RepID=A0AAE1AQY3_9GAST|nr:hypothetical protein RRG08_055367 [Elysia crispata]
MRAHQFPALLMQILRSCWLAAPPGTTRDQTYGSHGEDEKCLPTQDVIQHGRSRNVYMIYSSRLATAPGMASQIYGCFLNKELFPDLE